MTTSYLKARSFQFLPSEFWFAIKLLEAKAKSRYLLLSLLQITLAILEVIALGLLTVAITLGLNNYTTLSNEAESALNFLNGALLGFGTEGQLAILLISYVALTVAKTILSAVITLSSLNLLAHQAARVGFTLNRNLYDHGIKQIRFGKSQENLSGVTGSLDSLLIGYLGTLSQLAGDIATILMVCAASLVFNFEGSLLLILLFGLLLAMLHKFVNDSAGQLGEKVALTSAKLNRRILDSWLVYRELVLSQKIDDLLNPTMQFRLEIANSRARLSFLPSLSKYIFELFIVLGALTVSGVQLWISGITDAVNSFVLIAAASARLLPALLRLQGNLLSLRQSIGGGVFAKQLLASTSDIHPKRKPNSPSRFTAENFNAFVSVKDLSFTYPESKSPALKQVTFSIAPGSVTAITGASGSGKSTLLDLMLGFLKPSSGSILINGFDPMAVQRLWPGSMSYVPQDTQIFEGSILENIVFSSGDEYDQKRLDECIASSGLFEDLNDLNQGVHTLIGERGLRLSGGQRQRVGIARALYCDPKLLLFDESTSSLDPITENRIVKNIYRKTQNRSIVVVSHRLSTIMNSDNILYFREGRLVAQGTFIELKESEPEFLEQAQLSGL